MAQPAPTRKEKSRISHALSAILRHGRGTSPEKTPVDRRGFFNLADVLRLPKFRGVTVEVVGVVVKDNDKARFELEAREEGCFIRAVQGWSGWVADSIKDETALTPITLDSLPPGEDKLIVHGGYWKNDAAIQATGLHRGARKHVHFADDLPEEGAVKSGMRKNCEVAYWYSTRNILGAGMELFRSSNGVILCAGTTITAEGGEMEGIVPFGCCVRVQVLKPKT